MPITGAVLAPPFAGPIFTEWYWEPLFHLLLSAPFVMGLAACAGALVAWRGRRRGARRSGRYVGVRVTLAYLAIQLAVLLGWSLGWGEPSDWRRPDAPPPAPLAGVVAPQAPPGYRVADRFAAGDSLRLVYEGARGRLVLLAGPVAKMRGEPACDLASVGGSVLYLGPCRLVPSGLGGTTPLLSEHGGPRLFVVRVGAIYEIGWNPSRAEADAFALAAGIS